jgi:hypothetical protein
MMTPPEHDQQQQNGSEEQPARRSTRRRWLKAAGLAAVPLIITVKAQPAFAAKPQAKSNGTAAKAGPYAANGRRGG